MLSNAYFLAKFRFDTAENEPARNLQNFAKFANFADPNPQVCKDEAPAAQEALAAGPESLLQAQALVGSPRRAEGSPIRKLNRKLTISDCTIKTFHA